MMIFIPTNSKYNTIPYCTTGMICSSVLSVIATLLTSLLFCKMLNELQ